VLIFASSACSVRRQFTLPDHGNGASASRGVPVYAPAFAGTHCAYLYTRDGQPELTCKMASQNPVQNFTWWRDY